MGRPFICEGSPLDCNVFIVGINPVVDSLFWDFWKPETGFMKTEWDGAYIEKRKKETNLSYNPTITRKRLDCFFKKFKESGKVCLLETNLYSGASAREKDLPKENKHTKVFNFLLRTIKPKAIIAHGKSIRKYLWHLSGCDFKNFDNNKGTKGKDLYWQKASIFDFNTTLLGLDHISFQLSHKDCKELIEKIYNDLHSNSLSSLH